LEINIFTIVN